MRRFLFLFGVAVSTAFPQNYASYNNQPVARISFLRSQEFPLQNRFRDATLTTFLPMTDRGQGPFYDYAGNGYSATLSGPFQGYDRGVTGRFAPYFNKNVNNSYNVNPAPAVGAAFTVSVWAQINNPNTSGFARVVETDYAHGFYLGLDTTGSHFQFIVNGSPSVNPVTGGSFNTGQWPNNPWQMVTGVYDGANASLYVNGALAAGPIAASPPGAKTLALGLGGCAIASYCSTSGGNGYWDGELQSLRIYGRALSAAEVLAIYKAENH
jgi:hypothetical protein